VRAVVTIEVARTPEDVFAYLKRLFVLKALNAHGKEIAEGDLIGHYKRR